MSYASTSTAPALPTIEMLEYDKTWDVPIEEAPRPSNAFMLFIKWNSRYINRRSNAETVGPIWRSAPPDVEAHFINLAAQVAQKHKERFPGYVFAPKKKAETKEERKENIRPYPSSSQRPGHKNCEDMEEGMAISEGSSRTVEVVHEEWTTHTRRRTLESSSAVNHTIYHDAVNRPEISNPALVEQLHFFNAYQYDSRLHQNSVPALVEQPQLLGIEVEEDDEYEVEHEVEEEEEEREEEEEEMITAAIEIEPIEDDEVTFSVDDVNYLSSVLFDFYIDDWLIFED